MPRNWTFSAFDLLEEAQSLSRFFASARRAVAVVPVHHVYGFAFALMLPKCLGIPAIHLHPLTTADFFRSLQAGDMIVAFPLFWASVLRMAQGGLKASLPENLRGVTSGAPCPPEVIEGLLGKEANAGTPFLTEMTEIYGATEFGAVGMRRDCRGKYTLLPHWRRAQTGTEITADGPAEWGICRAKGKVSPLPDLFDWKDERQFIPAGRKDKAVQVSSINVFPAQVAKVICAHPKVSDCAVRLMRPDEGDRLKAFVVPRDGVCMLDKRAERNFRQELKTWLAERLATAAIPKSISLGDSLPITATGKATDWPISQVSQS